MAPHVWIPEPYNDGGAAEREASRARAEAARLRAEVKDLRARLGIPPDPPPVPPPVVICDQPGCYKNAIVRTGDAIRCFTHAP